MKQYRLRFQREFHAKIIAGEKSATMRFGKPKPFQVGDIVGLTHGLFDKYDEALAHARITEKRTILWRDVTDADLARTGADRKWYEGRYPTIQGCTVGEFIGFDLVSKEAARG